MQRKSFSNLSCPIARSLERVGEWWSILILRDAFYGMTRFDEFQISLVIAPNVLTRRLTSLVAAGLMERRQYLEKPPRYEYMLTKSGKAFKPVMIALLAWGNSQFAPDGVSVVLTDLLTGEIVDPVLVDAKTGKVIAGDDYILAAGPAASNGVHNRMAYAAMRRASPDKIPHFPMELMS
ncbi:winged helix-turn-helix transcriptional regulator [Glaciimonas immobilis]|uniref:DNA-binding HxlR family transcriptional regulator n=1 Tax=Glaciimonas immobilis TaxID=728004 RepID=A0A840RTT7_9BURK|nr:helix-turn-helix domain-containing protein [Glaciimonas immobilis]KAF3998341.1 helix-turn-helix transcriptional regulator [Glaciimonas immobilis]MBB5201967.1 DNA-binding HxlR family transcriptional regulator [Glaciimonas immobilis]